MFDQVSNRRRRLYDEGVDEFRFLQQDSEAQNATDYFCSPNAISRGAFEEEVLRILGDHREDVFGVVEVEPKACPGNVTFFKTEVKIPLLVTGELSAYVKGVIESEFEAEYNACTQQYCDPLFRTILNVTFIGVEGEGTEDTLVVIAVDGRCRGCRKDSDLFADPSGRQRFLMGGDATLIMKQPGGVASGRKVEIGRHSSFLRGLDIELSDEEDICYCDATPIADRQPNALEVFDKFESVITKLDNPNIVAPTDPPSAAPSAMPSGLPSEAPTRKPTPAPTPFPTPFPTLPPTPKPSVPCPV